MRIAYDASRAASSQPTGTERYSLELLRSLAEIDARNEYWLYFNGRPPDEVVPARPNFRTRSVPLPRLWTHIRLAGELLRDRPDLLFVPAHVLPIVHPRCSVVTVHDLGFRYFPEAHRSASRLYLDLSTRWACRRATRLIAISQATARDLRRLYGVPGDRIRVVCEGVDRRFAPSGDPAAVAALRERYGLGSAPYLLAVGTLQPRKNVLGLLRAFRLLLDEPVERCTLVLAGRPGWGIRSVAREVRQRRLHRDVRLLGYVPDEELPDLYSGALAYVQPSFHEGFGLTVLEALACGAPVVASNVSSLPEVVGDAGLLIDPRSPEAICGALRRLIASPELRAELSAKGQARAAEFSWDRCARQTVAVLEAAAEAGRP